MMKRITNAATIPFGLALWSFGLYATDAADTIIPHSHDATLHNVTTEHANNTLSIATDGDPSDSFDLSTPSPEDNDDELIPCPLCLDPSHEPWDKMARFDTGDAVVTCDDAFTESLTLRLSQAPCTEFQEWGRSLCRCGIGDHTSGSGAVQGSSGEAFVCRLCPDGSPLPHPTLAGLSDMTCAQLQVRAMRDDPAWCPVYQATVGTYCGCPRHNNTIDNDTTTLSTSICRICGERRLPNHLQAIGMLESQTCGELEFQVNQPDGRHDCPLFQKLYAPDCCGGDNEENDVDNMDPSVHQGSRSRRTMVSSNDARILILALVLVVQVLLAV